MKIFTKDEREIVLDTMKKHIDSRIYKRLHVLMLYDDRRSVPEIAEICYLDEATIRKYIKNFYDEGIPELDLSKYKGRASKLNKEQLDELKSHVANNMYITSEEVCNYVKTKYDVAYDRKSMAKLLKRLDFVYKKYKSVPSKANGEKQKEFLENTLTPCLGKANDNNPVYFLDAVHPTHNVHPHYGWILKGQDKAIKTNSGRQRININGALCYHDTSLVFREDETINGDSVVALLTQIRAKHSPDKKITIILDNAKYNRNPKIMDFVNNNGINLLFLPTYSPNLNLIERLWKFLKKKVCTVYYEHYCEFKKAIKDFLNNLKIYDDDLASLLTPNFNIINAI